MFVPSAKRADSRRHRGGGERDLVFHPGVGSLAGTHRRLLRFEWLLPGHGGRKRLSVKEMTQRMRQLTVRTRELEPRPADFTAMRW
jgi:hypothetical protein